MSYESVNVGDYIQFTDPDCYGIDYAADEWPKAYKVTAVSVNGRVLDIEAPHWPTSSRGYCYAGYKKVEPPLTSLYTVTDDCISLSDVIEVGYGGTLAAIRATGTGEVVVLSKQELTALCAAYAAGEFDA